MGEHLFVVVYGLCPVALICGLTLLDVPGQHHSPKAQNQLGPKPSPILRCDIQSVLKEDSQMVDSELIALTIKPYIRHKSVSRNAGKFKIRSFHKIRPSSKNTGY